MPNLEHIPAEFEDLVEEIADALSELTFSEVSDLGDSMRQFKVPWVAICDEFREDTECVPLSVIELSLGSVVLQFCVNAIIAGGHFTEDESDLSGTWPVTSHVGVAFRTHLNGYEDFVGDPEEHMEFLFHFMADKGKFGGVCPWVLKCALLLTFHADRLNANCDAANRFRLLLLDVAEEMLCTDSATQAENDMYKNLCRTADFFRHRELAGEAGSREAIPPGNRGEAPPSKVRKELIHDEQLRLARKEQPVPDTVLKESIEELEKLIGLPGVKTEIHRLTSFLKVQAQRRQHGLKGSSQTLHFVFTGNPGTGKTTVARILSKILYGFGILSTTKVVECDRSGLVGGYVGQTAIKTDEVVKSALDGVLFIDEAYSLAGRDSHTDYGEEAINTLLKRMEDYRDRLVVIVAGYPRLMDSFLATNPGLQSRFTRFINFQDYSIAELCQIFEKFAKEEEYELTPRCRAMVSIAFTIAFRSRDEKFGNA